MSTANDLRKAALTWPLDYTVTDASILDSFIGYLSKGLLDLTDTEHRTFLLFVACALDGGPRECRMLTGAEVASCKNPWHTHAIDPVAIQRKFCEVNNLTLRVEP